MKKMTKAELEMKCRFLEERLEKIPKRELEIRCKDSFSPVESGKRETGDCDQG